MGGTNTFGYQLALTYTKMPREILVILDWSHMLRRSVSILVNYHMALFHPELPPPREGKGRAKVERRGRRVARRERRMR